MYMYDGIGAVAISMKSQGAEAGAPFKVCENDTACPAASGEVFHGICQWQKEDMATVQTAGFVTLPYTGSAVPAVGYCKLVADGNWGVKVDSTVENNPARLVVHVDTTEQTVTFLL